MKALFANMGFLSQMAGIFMIIPIIVSFIYKETPATIALLITSMIFLVLGFILNSLCERKDLSFKDSNRLFFLSFILLGIIGAIPYFYVDATDGGFVNRVTDSVFESISGYTTTGFTIISDPDSLPKSIVLYRALTQFIGGIGIVFLLLMFFYPEDKLNNLSKTWGLDSNMNIKKTLSIVSIVYVALIGIIGLVSYLLGLGDPVTLFSYLFSAISGGGFAPVTDMASQVHGTAFGYVLIFVMILGASNFLVLAGLISLKYKEFLKSEIPIYLGLIFGSFILIKFLYSLSFFDSLFNVTSAMTNSGYQYMSFANFSEGYKSYFIVLMFIGGTSISAAGGIKLYRLGIIYKAVRKSIHDSINRDDEKVSVFEKTYTNAEVIQNFVVIVLMGAAAFFSAIIIQAITGHSFVDALFVTTSAIATTGLDVGIIVPTLGLGVKWLITFLMLIGRVEVFAFLIMFSKTLEKKLEKARADNKDSSARALN